MSEEKTEPSLVKKVLITVFLFSFLVMGGLSIKRALPEPKEERIYLAIKEYSPYKLQKRMGGLEIVNMKTDTKEKPSSAEVMHRLDEVDGVWGKEHLRVENSTVFVLDDNKSTIAEIAIETKEEREFLQRFFGI